MLDKEQTNEHYDKAMIAFADKDLAQYTENMKDHMYSLMNDNQDYQDIRNEMNVYVDEEE